MNIKSPLLALAASIVLFAAPSVFAEKAGNPPAAAANEPGKLIAVSDKDAAWTAKARKSYPLDVCVVSDEKLGSMGESPAYIYRVDGKPDRLVLFCCSGCEEDFMKDPAAHVAKLDAAQKKRE